MRKVRTITQTKQLANLVTLAQLLKQAPWLSRSTAFRYISAGKLPAYKLDGMILFNLEDIVAMIKRRGVGGGPRAPLLLDKPTETEFLPLPENYKILSAKEVEEMFKNVERDGDGNLVGWDSDEARPISADDDKYIKRDKA